MTAASNANKSNDSLTSTVSVVTQSINLAKPSLISSSVNQPNVNVVKTSSTPAATSQTSAVSTPPLNVSSSTELKARCLFDYKSQAANQVSFAASDVIVIRSRGAPGGWSQGTNLSGIRHLFIAYYCSRPNRLLPN